MLAASALLVVAALVALVVLSGDDGESANPGSSTTTPAADPTTTETGSVSTEPSGPTTIAPGEVGVDGRTATAIPFQLGDSEGLDNLAASCAAGDLGSCDQLYDDSPVGSNYENFGATCGARVEFSPETPCVDNPDL